MTGQQICTCRFCGRDDLTPQGHKPHETHCDENPNPGVPCDQQERLGILESGEGAADEGHPNPDQSVSAEPSSGLPSRRVLSGEKTPRERGRGGGPPEPDRAATGADDPPACPNCGSDETLPASDQLEQYKDYVSTPNPKAVVAYRLARWACTEPDCATIWGVDAQRPLTMEEVVSA